MYLYEPSAEYPHYQIHIEIHTVFDADSIMWILCAGFTALYGSSAHSTHIMKFTSKIQMVSSDSRCEISNENALRKVWISKHQFLLNRYR